MGMVLLESEPVQRWLDEHHGGDQLRAFTRVISPTNQEVSEYGAGADDVGTTEATRVMFGLTQEKRSPLILRQAALLVVTATHFYLLTLGGFKERIKTTTFDARRDRMQFAVHDLQINNRHWRHWLVRGFPDGQYILEPQVVGKGGKRSKIMPGSAALLAELGGQVEHRVTDAAPS